MRKTLLTLAAALVIGVAGGTSYAIASSSVGWPAACSKVGCVDKHLNNLNTRLNALQASLDRSRARISTLTGAMGCINHVNMTWYSAYVYDGNAGNYRWLNFLNNTQYGDNVDYQLLYNACTPSPFQ